MLHRLSEYYQTMTSHYEAMAFKKVCMTIQNFLANDISGFYLTLLKDRLYCNTKESLQRKSAVTVLVQVIKSHYASSCS